MSKLCMNLCIIYHGWEAYQEYSEKELESRWPLHWIVCSSGALGLWAATQRIIKPFADYAPVPNFFTPVCTGSIFSALFCLWVARLRTFGLLPIRVWQGAYLGAALITRFPSVYPHATWSFVVNARKVLKRMISWGNNAILWLPHINSLHPSKWTTGIHPHIRITKNISKLYLVVTCICHKADRQSSFPSQSQFPQPTWTFMAVGESDWIWLYFWIQILNNHW